MQIENKKFIFTFSCILMVISLYLFLSHEFNLEDAAYKISYEYINTKDMATTKVAMKCGYNVDNSELVNVELEKYF